MPGRPWPTGLLTVYLHATMSDGLAVWATLVSLYLLMLVARRSPFLALALPIAAAYLQLLTTR